MSKITLLHANPFYEHYLKRFYAKNNGLDKNTYQDQCNLIFTDCFALSDFWKKNLEETGNFNGIEIISNNKIIQTKWAEENNIAYDLNDWSNRIFDAQIDYYKPDILFIRDLGLLHPGFFNEIKKRFPFIKLTIAWDGIARNDTDLFSGCDLVLSCIESTVSFYNSQGIKSYYLQHGFESTILEKLNKKDIHINTSFIGSVGIGKKHLNRVGFLANLHRNQPIDVYIPQIPSNNEIIKTELYKLKNLRFNELIRPTTYLDLSLLRNINRGAAYGIDMYQILSDSLVTLNMHIESAGKSAANMRLFEATGVGTCLLTDEKENLGKFFEIDKEILTYKSEADCLEKIRYLINNPLRAREIGMAAQKKTLSSYTLKKIISEFSTILLNSI